MQETLLASYLGPLLIRWSDLGLEKIDIVTSTTLNSDAETPATTKPAWLQNFLAELNAHVELGQPFSQWPPLNQTGWTDFQKNIYEVLFATNPGETLTYGELAARCDRPKAARSVGAAMSRNRFPILIPCHRVLPAGGKLGHYTGGEGPLSKKKLLNRELSLLSERK